MGVGFPRLERMRHEKFHLRKTAGRLPRHGGGQRQRRPQLGLVIGQFPRHAHRSRPDRRHHAIVHADVGGAAGRARADAGPGQHADRRRAGPVGCHSNSGTYFNQWASASGAGTLETLWLQAASQSNGANSGRYDVGSRATTGVVTFELSAHTGLRIDADAAVSASSSGLIAGPAFTSSVGFSQLYAAIGQVGAWEYASDTVAAGTLDLRGEADALLPKSEAYSRTLNLVYDNTTAGAKSGVLEFTVSADLSQFPPSSPVPEPASYALFGAGLALLGAGRARRRRQR
nr:PEP-CTERM sorting domain-containing protein [Duganella sp. SG902]